MNKGIQKITPEQFLQGIDAMIEQCKKDKQFYLDYRFGSGMTSTLEEFCKRYDQVIMRFESIKKHFKLVKGIAVQQESENSTKLIKSENNA